MEELKTNNKKPWINQEKDLIITIDQHEKIIKFNDECERISGYNERDVINKDFIEILIPIRYSDQWKKIISGVRKDKLIDDFTLPVQTKHGHEIMISWSSFPVKNFGGIVEDIGLVGKLINSWEDTKQTAIGTQKKETMPADYFDEFEQVVNDLEKKNKDLEKKNEILEKKLKQRKEKKETNTQSDIVGKSLYHVPKVVSGKKKREELHVLMKDLDERQKQLDKLQRKLEKDKLKINEKKNEFIRWREKLMIIESEIESRKKWVENKEKALEKISNEQENIQKPRIKTKEYEEFNEEVFNKIPESAAVLQRSIFKQVNSTFADLLGYGENEIVDKSIFDFIEPEGLTGVEEYYFHRLKGDDTSAFDTLFLTKDNVIIFIQVNTQPINYNGEKAEIAIFKKLNIKKE